jgi:hypothetical protein
VAEAFCVGAGWYTESTHVFAAELEGDAYPTLKEAVAAS